MPFHVSRLYPDDKGGAGRAKRALKKQVSACFYKVRFGRERLPVTSTWKDILHAH